MRSMARSALSMSRRARVLTALASVVAYGSVLFIPASVSSAAITDNDGEQTTVQLTAISQTAQDFGGVAAVGALFTMSDGKLDTHICTASVVHSAHGDLVVTAAHCLIGIAGQIAFVPGYNNGKEPYGIWQVTAVYSDKAWQSDEDPDDDVAFLRLSDASGGVPIENITGAEQLGTDPQQPTLVRVIGYPDDTEAPVSCTNRAKVFSATQLEFDCDGYTDGTSGGPFLASVSSSSGEGTVIGVIGGYEQGGDTPQVSYASAFGPTVKVLFQTAESGS